jgi:hypothetical protein
MSSSINTACKSHNVHGALVTGVFFCLAMVAVAQDAPLRVPSDVVAGQAASIATTGNGSATFYLRGPSISFKRDVELGQNIDLSAKELQTSGDYVAVLCAGTCSSARFFVAPGKPTALTFLVHPSRAPVGLNDVISGVALPFDQFHNLILTPATIQFQLTAKGSAPSSRNVQTHDGVAWFRTSSGKSAGALQISASLSDLVARRVVQQVASDPCNLRIKGQRTAKGILVETEPVRDCLGNPVPDGTIVTFTAKDGHEVSFVDAPVKQDIARATLVAKGPVIVSAASGVATGNELRLGSKE